MSNQLVTVQIQHIAESMGLVNIDPQELKRILVQTAFKTETQATDEQMAALLIVAGQYNLNPWTKEIYAFPDKNKGIIPVVGVDGWSRIINSNPNLNGIEFNYSDEMILMEGAKSKAPSWIEVVIHRKDREKPTIVREYLDETYRAPFKSKSGYVVEGPWQSHPKRFLRHKCLIQGARLAFGFAGIYDQDEAERIIEGQAREIKPSFVNELPEGYEDFESDHLVNMQSIATNGTAALADAYKLLPTGKCKTLFWATHSVKLKEVAQQSDEQAKESEVEHTTAE